MLNKGEVEYNKDWAEAGERHSKLMGKKDDLLIDTIDKVALFVSSLVAFLGYSYLQLLSLHTAVQTFSCTQLFLIKTIWVLCFTSLLFYFLHRVSFGMYLQKIVNFELSREASILWKGMAKDAQNNPLISAEPATISADAKKSYNDAKSSLSSAQKILLSVAYAYNATLVTVILISVLLLFLGFTFL